MTSNEKNKQRSKRVYKHNKMIREMREKGELKPLGTTTYSQLIQNWQRNYRKLSANGSLLPNKFALWENYEYIELDY